MFVPCTIVREREAKVFVCFYFISVFVCFYFSYNLIIHTGGWYGLLIFRENRKDSDFAGLKLTNHLLAH